MIQLEIKLLIKLQQSQKTSPQINSETNEEILTGRYICPKEIQKIIDDLRLI